MLSTRTRAAPALSISAREGGGVRSPPATGTLHGAASVLATEARAEAGRERVGSLYQREDCVLRGGEGAASVLRTGATAQEGRERGWRPPFQGAQGRGGGGRLVNPRIFDIRKRSGKNIY